MKLDFIAEAKRRLGDEMSNARAAELLQRKIAHHEVFADAGSYRQTAFHKLSNYNTGKMANKVPDIRSLPQQDATAVIQDMLGSKDLAVGFYGNPSGYYVKKTRETRGFAGFSLPMVWVGDKAEMQKYDLDEDDFHDFIEANERTNYATAQKKTLEGRLSRVNKKHAEEQAASIAKQATASGAATSASSSSNPPPTALYLSPKNSSVRNPYYSGPTNRFIGHPAQAPFQKNATKSMMNVLLVACQNANHPLSQIYYSTSPTGEDLYYAESADSKVKIYVTQPVGSGMSIIINGRVLRLKRIYYANDIAKTTQAIQTYA